MTLLDPTTARLGGGDVLVLRALGLGDALTGVAALRGVRRGWPDRRLVLAGPEDIGGWLVGHGVVDAVLPTRGLDPLWASSLSGSGHVAVNLHGSGPESHRLLTRTAPSRLVAFGCQDIGHDGPAWRRDEHEVDRWCRLVRTAGGACGREDLRLSAPVERGDAVLLHPGAASASRRWPAERWVALARRLVASGHRVVLTGSPAEAALCATVADAVPEAVSTCGRLGMAALAEVVAGARLLVCGDTGVAHLATAFSTPSVLLFGPTPPAWWGPPIGADRHTVIWKGERPGDPHGSEVDPALATITPEEVAEAVEALLDDQVRRCG